MQHDEHLIARVITGEEAAFRELYGVFSKNVYNTALSLLQHQEEAEDITQEVFIEIHRSLKTFTFQSSLQTWIYSITVHTCYAHLKKQRSQKRFAFITSLFGLSDKLEHDKPHFEHPGVVLENKEHASVLFKALSKLPIPQQTAFTLVKIEGLSYREAAQVMSVTESALESLMSRALKNLRSWLSEYYKISFDTGAGNLSFWLLM